jgi:hypothetical protein
MREGFLKRAQEDKILMAARLKSLFSSARHR